jgi:iron complex transport system ATP-binding protein
MISFENVSVTAGGKEILSEVTGQITRTTAILGPNGSGKSTLLTVLYRGFEITGSHLQVSGNVTVDGNRLDDFRRNEIARTMSVVPQIEPDHPGLRAIDVVDLGRLAHRGGLGRTRNRAAKNDEEICLDALEQVGMGDSAYRLFAELSGGERQRVVIARALAQGSSYMLLDEPTNHLDMRHQLQLMEFLRNRSETTVAVLHDLNLALDSCEDAIVLNHGRVHAQGPIRDVLTQEVVENVWGVHVQQIETEKGIQFAVIKALQGEFGSPQ